MILMFTTMALVIRKCDHADKCFQQFEEEVAGKADHDDHMKGLPAAFNDIEEYKTMRLVFLLDCESKGVRPKSRCAFLISDA